MTRLLCSTSRVTEKFRIDLEAVEVDVYRAAFVGAVDGVEVGLLEDHGLEAVAVLGHAVEMLRGVKAYHHIGLLADLLQDVFRCNRDRNAEYDADADIVRLILGFWLALSGRHDDNADRDAVPARVPERVRVTERVSQPERVRVRVAKSLVFADALGLGDAQHDLDGNADIVGLA